MVFRLFLFSLLSISFIPILQLRASTYYFSSSEGDDSRKKEAAVYDNSPWKSLEKLNSIISDLNPGDSILFKKGDIFYGSIAIRKSGTTDSPLFFGSYGKGDMPIIKAVQPVSNWENAGKGIF